MKHPRLLSAVALLLWAGAASAQDLPSRRAGLWEMQMQMQGMPGSMGSQHCIDAKTDADLQRRAMAGQEGERCTQKSFKRTATGFEMEAECSSPEGKTFVSSVASGDFNASYTIDGKARFEPPRHGMREAQMKISARHAGACPAGMAPGQTRVSGMPAMQGMSPEQMQKMIEDMQKAAGRK